MSYAKTDRHMPDRQPNCACCDSGITAPYCPPPICVPPKPCPPLDACPKPQNHGLTKCTESAYQPPLHKAVEWPRPIKACPPAHQSGIVCAAPPVKPPKRKGESVLLQKIIGCERRSIPQLCVQLMLEDLPECAMPPFRLVMVQQSGAQPWWTPLESHGPDTRMHINVYIPVCCQVCDAAGKMYHATSLVKAQISFRPPCPPSDCWRHSIFIVPCVRLIGGEVCSDDSSFCAKLEICLEIYLLRPEPCTVHHPEPAAPELPLYPQPRQSSMHWQQFSAGFVPYA
ncbi:MAG: hypothetical protein E7319_03305 [Clostridiales bacterium]|nr:hypothetical protein [Clostridiales bacterium]